MTIVLYEIPPSPPCRAVKMTAEHLGIPLEIKTVDLMKGEHKKPEFLAINPFGKVPAIDDDGFLLWESRVIIAYLINKYAPDSPLYPKEPKTRAVVERMLYFDNDLFQAESACVRAIVFENRPCPTEEVANVKQCLAQLEKFLETTTYAAGNHLTVADYSILSTIVLLDLVLGFSFDEYPKITAWLQRMKKETPKYKEINEIPLKAFREQVVDVRKSQNAATP